MQRIRASAHKKHRFRNRGRSCCRSTGERRATLEDLKGSWSLLEDLRAVTKSLFDIILRPFRLHATLASFLAEVIFVSVRRLWRGSKPERLHVR
nr:hypothetical protein CFP56_52504 [Quercus suber]